MPIYEYKCSNCGEITEVFQKTYAQNSVNCQHCGSNHMERIVSIPGVVKVAGTAEKGTTCCGRTERCDTPPCSVGEGCRRDRQ
jgi:putative FmdB family regulatory protein